MAEDPQLLRRLTRQDGDAHNGLIKNVEAVAPSIACDSAHLRQMIKVDWKARTLDRDPPRGVRR